MAGTRTPERLDRALLRLMLLDGDGRIRRRDVAGYGVLGARLAELVLAGDIRAVDGQIVSHEPHAPSGDGALDDLRQRLIEIGNVRWDQVFWNRFVGTAGLYDSAVRDLVAQGTWTAVREQPAYWRVSYTDNSVASSPGGSAEVVLGEQDIIAGRRAVLLELQRSCAAKKWQGDDEAESFLAGAALPQPVVTSLRSLLTGMWVALEFARSGGGEIGAPSDSAGGY
jgi:hypothetical protein